MLFQAPKSVLAGSIVTSLWTKIFMSNTNPLFVDAGEAPPERQPVEQPPTASLASWYGLIVLMIAGVFALVDRQILVLVAQPVQHAFGLSDAQVGLLQGTGIAFFAGVAAVPLGWLADRMDRRLLLSLAIVVWSVATAACGFARSFEQLFIATIGIGIGEAGLVPIVYGLLPDLFPARQRVLANSIFAMATLLGGGLGMSLGGAMLHAIGVLQGAGVSLLVGIEPWRLGFFFVAVPGPVIALIILTIRLRRTAGTSLPASGDRTVLALAPYLRENRKTVICFFGALGLTNLAMLGLMTWIPVVAMRSYGVAASEAGEGIGLSFMLGSLGGFLLCSMSVKRFTPRWGSLTSLRLCEYGLGVAALLAVAMLFCTSATQLYTLIGLQLAAITVGVLLFPSLMQSISPPSLRSRVTSLGLVVIILVQTVSPVLIGYISDHMSRTSNGLLHSIIYVSTSAFVMAAALMRISEPAMRRTLHIYADDLGADKHKTERLRVSRND
jgi:MFS family permease